MINGLFLDEYFNLQILSQINSDFWYTNDKFLREPKDLERLKDSKIKLFFVHNGSDYMAKIIQNDNWIRIKLYNNKFLGSRSRFPVESQVPNKYIPYFNDIISVFKDYSYVVYYTEEKIYFKFYATDLKKKCILLSFEHGYPEYD